MIVAGKFYANGTDAASTLFILSGLDAQPAVYPIARRGDQASPSGGSSARRRPSSTRKPGQHQSVPLVRRPHVVPESPADTLTQSRQTDRPPGTRTDPSPIKGHR
jgi:hypothetical protein